MGIGRSGKVGGEEADTLTGGVRGDAEKFEEGEVEREEGKRGGGKGCRGKGIFSKEKGAKGEVGKRAGREEKRIEWREI